MTADIKPGATLLALSTLNVILFVAVFIVGGALFRPLRYEASGRRRILAAKPKSN